MGDTGKKREGRGNLAASPGGRKELGRSKIGKVVGLLRDKVRTRKKSGGKKGGLS